MTTDKPPDESSRLCEFCHVGVVRQQLIPYVQWYNDELIVIPKALAEVCDYCGEKTFDPKLVNALQQMLREESQQRPRRVRARLDRSQTEEQRAEILRTAN